LSFLENTTTVGTKGSEFIQLVVVGEKLPNNYIKGSEVVGASVVKLIFTRINKHSQLDSCKEKSE